MNPVALKAAQAYAQQLGAAAPAAQGGLPAAGAPSFADLVSGAVGDAVSSMKTSEATSAAAVTGQAGLVDVVTAISSAEVTLQTVVSVRDKMVEAYQEILRMPI